MASAKTMISIRKSLYDMLSVIARDLELSSTLILELAVEEFVQKYQNNKELLQMINAAYHDLPDQEDKALLNNMKLRQRTLVEGQW